MKDLMDLSQIDSEISEEEIIERAVIAAIELYAKRLLPTSKRTKSTVYLSPELDSHLNSIKEFLGISRQDLVEEAVMFYTRWRIYARHINRSILDKI